MPFAMPASMPFSDFSTVTKCLVLKTQHTYDVLGKDAAHARSKKVGEGICPRYTCLTYMMQHQGNHGTTMVLPQIVI